MVSATQLATLRAVANRELTDVCEIRGASEARDDIGGVTKTWAAVASGIPCRITAAGLSPEEREIAERIGAVAAWRIAFPAGTAVTSEQRIVSGGRTFEVVASLGPRTDEVLRRVLGQEVT